MKKSKFFELLLSLSIKEFVNLKNFANSYKMELLSKEFNILNYLIDELSKFERIDEEEIELHIVNEFFNKDDLKKAKQSWNHSKSKLSVFLNKYIAFEQLTQKPRIKNQLLLEYYQTNELNKNFESFLKRLNNNWSSYKIDYDTQYYKYKHQEIILFRQHGQRFRTDELEKMNEALDDFYIENKLRLLVERYNKSRVLNLPLPRLFFSESIKLEDLPLRTISGRLYYLLCFMMKEPDNTAHYQKAKSLFFQYENEFSNEYIDETCVYLMNQCIYLCHLGYLEYAVEYLDYIKYLIKKKIFIESEKLSISRYSNTVYMSLVSNDLKWGEAFIMKYSDLVVHDEIVSIRKLNLANIYFHKNEYGKALALIQDYSFSELYFKITFDKLCIKIYFEEGLESNLKSKLKAFQKYIQRSIKLPESRKQKNINFISAVKRMMRESSSEDWLKRKDYLLLDYVWLVKKAKWK